MYRFSKSFRGIIRDIRSAVKDVTEETLPDPNRLIARLTYTMFEQDQPHAPIGLLHVTVEYNDYGLHILCNAQLSRDPGRPNQVNAQSEETADIIYAIGFTCASAFWRVYQAYGNVSNR